MWDAVGSAVSAGINYFSAQQSAEAQREIAAQQMAAQREFAQHGVRWKVADAQAAGIHPLAALGAQTHSFAPISVGGTTPDLSGVGQDIGRAISAMKGLDEKSQEIAEKASRLSLEKGALENDLLRSQIRRLNSAGTGPGMPSQGNVRVRHLIDGQPATQSTTPSGAKVSVEEIKQQSDTAPATARVRPAAVKLYTNPYMTDAEDVETRYGDIAENVAGAANLVGDVGYTAYKHWPYVRDYVRRKAGEYWNGGAPRRVYISGR